MSNSLEVAKKPETVYDITKRSWVSPSGLIVPDYAYPLVEKLKQFLSAQPDTTISGLGAASLVAPSTIKEVVQLLTVRLALLNVNDVDKNSLAVLPKDEYKIFKAKGITHLPDKTALPGTGAAVEEEETLEKLVTALAQRVVTAFQFKITEKKIEKISETKSLRRHSKIDVATFFGFFGGGATSVLAFITNIIIHNGGMFTTPGAWISVAVPAGVSVASIIIGVSHIPAQEKAETQYLAYKDHTEQVKIITSYLIHSTPALDAKGNLVEKEDQ